MEKLEITLYNIGKPNANRRVYTKEVIDKALEKLEEQPLFLFDSMPINFEAKASAEHVIGRCIESRWEDDSTLVHTFKINKDYFNSELKVVPFGSGTLAYNKDDGTYLVEDLKINGFALSKSCAWRSSVKKI